MFDKLFDFSDISNFMSTLTESANQKAVAAKEVARVASVEKSNIADSADRYNAEAQKSLERLQGINAKGDEARRMAESTNIIDRISLIGDQILDPRNFTAEGRSRQISEMTQSLGAQGQIHNIEVNASEARIEETKASAILATAGVDAQMTKLRTQVDGLSLMNTAMAQTESLRQRNLADTDLPTIQQALLAPPDPSLNGKIVIAGMTYEPAELRERQKNLETRNALSMLTPQATDPDFAAKLRVNQNLQLANYSLPELETLRANKYIMPDGTQVEPQVWDGHYERQNSLQQQALQRQMNQATLENQVPMMLKESMTMADKLQTAATPGTPLSMARNNFLAAANNVATLAAQDTTPNGKMFQVAALQKAQQEMVKAVDIEANRKAAGDKQLADIYRDQMLGQPIQPSQVEDVLRSRYVKGSGFGEILPSETAIRVRKNADQSFLKLKQAAASNLDPMATKQSDKELKEQAIAEAIELERSEAGNVGINKIQQASSQRTDNPAIKSGMVPAMVFDTQIRAAETAWQDIGHKAGLTPDQIIMVRNGKYAEAGLSAEKASSIISEANVASVSYEYDMYEKQKPGLGYEMQQWYMKTLPEMARNYTSNLDPIHQTMTGDAVLDQAQKLGTMYTMADESANGRGLKMAQEMATGAKKPENMWPVLLHMNGRLADSQKQAIYYDVIMPAITQSRSQGANDDVTTAAIFQALTTYKSNDPTLMSAIKTAQRELPQELDRFNVMWSTVMAQGAESRLKSRLVGKDPAKAEAQINKVMPWLARAQ